MSNVLNDSFKHFYLLFIVIIGVILGITACENPGAVGNELTNPEAVVDNDTLIINDVQALDATSYSGQQSFFSAGKYNDPLFGDMTATGYIKPALPPDGDTVRTDAKMIFRLLLDANQVYGDSAATQDYTIYEVGELWRGPAVKLNDEIQVNTNKPVASFSLGLEDSLDISLSSDWVEEYREFSMKENADSLIRYQRFGLAVVAENNNKIAPFEVSLSSTRFVVQNPEADTFEVGPFDWAYTLDRNTSNTSIPQGSVPLQSTYESVINFADLGISDLDIPASGLSKAELVFYENRTALEQSLQAEPASVVRAQETSADLHLVDPADIPENIDPGGSVNNISRVQGVYESGNGAYRFDITNLVESILRSGLSPEQEFFLTFPNDGIIKSSLIYTDSDQVPADKKPKIIITSLKNTSS